MGIQKKLCENNSNTKKKKGSFMGLFHTHVEHIMYEFYIFQG